jgi:hypothetical protein
VKYFQVHFPVCLWKYWAAILPPISLTANKHNNQLVTLNHLATSAHHKTTWFYKYKYLDLKTEERHKILLYSSLKEKNNHNFGGRTLWKEPTRKNTKETRTSFRMNLTENCGTMKWMWNGSNGGCCYWRYRTSGFCYQRVGWLVDWLIRHCILWTIWSKCIGWLRFS